MGPTVSFIIPFYNSGATIQETIDSILQQSFEDFDIWIINDGSTDIYSLSKLDELKSNPRIKILHQENAGPSIARNNAILKTNARYILPIDADNKICNGVVEKALSVISEDGKTGAVYGNFMWFGERGGVKIQEKFEMNRALLYNQVDTCALIRREVFEGGVMYDEFLSKPGLEDWEFWINMVSQGWQLRHLNCTFFEMRVSEQSRTFQVANKNIYMIKEYVHKKHVSTLAIEYEGLFYNLKMLKESPDFRIGSLFLYPYRSLKKLFRSLSNE